MSATCTITFFGEPSLNDETNVINGGPVTVYAGQCTVAPDQGGATSTAGDQQRDLDRYTLRLPADTDGLEVGQAVAVAGDDPMLAGLQLQIDRVFARSTSVYRTLRCVDTKRVRPGP